MKVEKPILKYIVLALGFMSLILGLIGVVVPILPTTPFILLAAFLFLHSSKKIYKWLHENQFFGKYLKSYKEGKGLPLKMKIFIITLLYSSIIYELIYQIENIWLKLFLVLVAVLVSIHIFTIKTNKKI